MLNTLVVVWDHIKLCKNHIFAYKGLERKITMKLGIVIQRPIFISLYISM